MKRFTFYSLTALGLALFGMMATLFTFGAYTMQDMCKDVIAVIWVIAMADCIVTIGKEIF